MTDVRVLVDTNVLIHHISGDKHETSRAMAQLEIEKQQVSLGNLLAMQDVLLRLDPPANMSALAKALWCARTVAWSTWPLGWAGWW